MDRGFDPPWATEALGEFRLAERERTVLDETLTALRKRVDDARSVSRIVTAREPSSLLDRLSAAFEARGPKVADAPKPYSRKVTTPEGLQFVLWAIASPGTPSATMTTAIRGLISDSPRGPGLVVVNFEADSAPSRRDPQLPASWIFSLSPTKLRGVSAIHIYEFLRSFDETDAGRDLWRALADQLPIVGGEE
jgi:hypothetical protein